MGPRRFKLRRSELFVAPGFNPWENDEKSKPSEQKGYKGENKVSDGIVWMIKM
jgi:hypothetical protein